jgi:phosphoserine phosphatase SerB
MLRIRFVGLYHAKRRCLFTVSESPIIFTCHPKSVMPRSEAASAAPQINQNPRSALELSVSGRPRNVDLLREELFKVGSSAAPPPPATFPPLTDAARSRRMGAGQVSMTEPIDVAVQEDDIFRRNRRLILFDMDSTLIQCEVIDELAKKAGVGKQVAEITESAMRGEIDFQESFRQRMRLLKGMDESVLQGIADTLPVTEGAPRLISNLRRLGYKVGILSGGFTYFARRLQKELGVDYVHANELDFKDGKLTGEVKGEIVDAQKKAELLKEIAAAEGLSLKQVIAVGDGANDIPMLSLAGLGVAFHAKPKVREQARVAVSTLGLDGILYLIGIRDQEASATWSLGLPEVGFPLEEYKPARL